MKKSFVVKYEKKDNRGDFAFGNVDGRFGATERYFTKDGSPWLPTTGEIHFSRLNRRMWETELAKMKAQGLDGASVYVFWNHHEIKSGLFDFSGDNDIKSFLSICKKTGLKVVLRIGPWCHGEVRYGGFPDYLTWIIGKRSNNKIYLHFVKRYWKRLYGEVKDYCDGETVVGIQIENEYGGSINHIVKLRQIAEDIGFKTPFFTMTAWPSNLPDKRFVPMCGGYPEAPWATHKKPLKPDRRFAICAGRTETAIGEDLVKTNRTGADFNAYPYAGCEVGTGNQVTAHRRPLISDKDGYGVAFAKFASGMNWLGYYMYHGGRNPRGRLMQESRRTLYPNNYPIIDYDFQAPVSKDGEIRRHADRLRLIHYFINFYDTEFARTQAFFPDDKDMPYSSVRSDENHAYVFIGNYERGLETLDISLDISVENGKKTAEINGLKVDGGAMWFFPVFCRFDGVNFDYITAQPIAMIDADGCLHVYFMKFGKVRICRDGEETGCDAEETDFDSRNGKIRFHFLDAEKALSLYIVNGKPYFSKGTVYQIGNRTKEEVYSGYPGEKDGCVKLISVNPVKLPYGHYLYSKGRREYFKLIVNKELLTGYDDVQIELSFTGLNLQVFSRGVLVDDCFNTDGVYRFRAGGLREDLEKDNELLIKACAATSFGAGKVYNETGISAGKIALKVKDIKSITVKELPL